MADWTLVTGGAGYVGAVLVEELVSAGTPVRVLDALLHGQTPVRSSDGKLEVLEGDIRDRETRRAALAGVRDIVHLAAIVGDPACARSPDLARQVNLEVTRDLLDEAAAAGVRRFLFASTCSNYGRLTDPDAYATEEWELRPISLYAETKVAAEQEVLTRADGNLEVCSLRFATVYGASPRMRFDLTVNEFARELVLGRELVVYGEQFWRPYIHVRDAASAAVTALGAPAKKVAGQVFNVGSTAENYRKLDLVEILRERVPDARIQFVARDEDPRDYRVSFDKISGRLGFRTSWTVPEGIDEVMLLLRDGTFANPFADVYRN